MTKRKRTLKQVEAMQAKAVRLQENIFNLDAAFDLEGMTPEQYARLRHIEIVPELDKKPTKKGKKQ